VQLLPPILGQTLSQTFPDILPAAFTHSDARRGLLLAPKSHRLLPAGPSAVSRQLSAVQPRRLDILARHAYNPAMEPDSSVPTEMASTVVRR
jgi:hypothetical protein